MNRKLMSAVAILIIIAMVLTSFSVVIFADTVQEEEYLDKRMDAFERYLKFIHENYKDDISYEDLINSAFEGVTEALDPYSIYYPEESEVKNFTNQVSGEYVGVGIKFKTIKEGALITSLVGGGSAIQQGLMEGDIIIKAGKNSFENVTTSYIQSSLMQKEGTKIDVTVKRENSILNFTLTCAKLKTDCVNFGMLENNVGYIKIIEVDADCHQEFSYAKRKLIKDGAKTLILDLRNNPGGYFNEAIDIVDEFLAEGTISIVQKRGKELKTYKATDEKSWDIETVVLINGGTASAAEVIAAGLKENNAAKLVGTNTYGKGVAQNLFKLPDDTYFKLSIWYFLSPKGNTIHEVGVSPNYMVANSYNSESVEKYASFAPMSEKIKYTQGQFGLNVYGAQQRLGLLGYEVDINGNMDNKTVEAIKKFQKETGIYSYGVLDYTTMSKIDEVAYDYACGNDGEDMQLNKALELLK